ncbi:MAG: MFS transporter [Chloroflexi bacterium]|nr:MFS transporter [Chloroflexota bacterium]
MATPQNRFVLPLAWINRDGRLIILSRAVRTFAQGAVSVILAIYLDRLGFSLVQIGAFISIGLVGTAVYALLVGLFASRIGLRRLLMLFTLGSAVMGVTLAFSDSFPLLALAALITSFSASGGGSSAAQPLELASLPETAPSHRRTDVFAIYDIAATGATALGALAAGLPQALQGTFGMTDLAAMRVIFLGYTALHVAAALCYLFVSARVEIGTSGQRWTNPLKLPSRKIIFTLSALFSVDHFAGGLLAQSLVSYWFFTEFGVKLGSIAFIFFASNLLAAASLWVAAKLANRIGLINTMVFSHIPSSVLLILMPLAPFAWLAVGLWLARSFLGQMDVPTRQSYTMAVVAPEERVAMASTNVLTRSLVAPAGPSVATWLWSAASASLPFIATGILKIAYDLSLWVMFRKVKTPEEERRAEAWAARQGRVPRA